MFADLGFTTLTAPQAAVWFGLALGVLFGVLGQRTRFCLRRGLAGSAEERGPALAVWLVALAAAVVGTQVAIAAGLIDFGSHRYTSASLPVLAIVIGGLAFGAGMVLTRGCASRLTVLTGQGNLRALTVLAVFAVVAHATLKGVLAPVRTGLGSVTMALESGTLPGNPLIWSALIAVAVLAFALRSGARWTTLAGGAAIGLLVPLAWVGTGFVLFDDFDPIAHESLSFTLPWAESLFFVIASTSISATFGVGLVGGVILGGAASALAFREWKLESFETPAQTVRYIAGGALMGLGGVLAGGCTVGAGLSGTSTLSVAAFLALGSIVLGALAARALAERPAAIGIPAE